MSFNPLNLLEPQYLMGLIAERQDFGLERPKYIGQKYFPRRNFPEQHVLWETIQRENRLAGIYSSKGKAVPGDDIGFGNAFAKLVWIKAAKYLDPDIVTKIKSPGMVAVYKEGGSAFVIQGIADRVAAKVREYMNFIDDQIAAQEEYFALQAMQGELNWPPLGNDGQPLGIVMPEWNADEKLHITWPFVDEFTQDIKTLTGVPAIPGGTNRAGTGYWWNETDANPRKDLEVIADMMLELKGVDAENADLIMSRKVLSYMAELANIQRWITGVNYESVNAGMAADIFKVKEKIKTMFGYEINLYDAKWTYLDGVDSTGKEVVRSVRFLPSWRMLVVPRGEQFGVMAQAPHENQSGDWVYGPSIWVYTDPRPPREREMGMDNICFPLLQQPEGVGVFKVMG